MPQREAEETFRDWKPQSTFEQSFVVNHPVDEVWDLFADVAAGRRCLPGATLTGETGGSTVSRQDAHQGRSDRR